MKRMTKRMTLLSAFLLALSGLALTAGPAAAQGDEMDDVDQPYTDYGADTDEIMEVDDALTDEARRALESREAGLDRETMDLLDGIKWLGHASFLIEAEKTIYIDPYDLPRGMPKADIIFVTHGHRDHLSPEDIVRLLKPGTIVVTSEAAQSLLPEEVEHITGVTPGTGIVVDGIKVEVVPAYNKKKDFHPKERGDVGFVIHLEGRTIYHAGDTDFIDEMKNITTDVALLPAGGKYTMDAAEAAEAANTIKPRVAIPMHWGKIVGSEEDARAFVAACKVPAVILPVETKTSED